MSRRLTLLIVAITTALLSGCGVNNGMQANGYGYGTATAYGSTGYDTGYGSGYDSSYGSSYGTGSDTGSYGSGYDTGYGSGSADYGAGSSYGSDYGAGTGSDDGASPSPSPSASATPAPAAPVSNDPPVLSAWVSESKKTGVLGLAGVTAKVEINNPADRTLSGLLTVRFTRNGDPMGTAQTRRVTLHPKEKQVLSFTAKGLLVNDAEASITTDNAGAGAASNSTVRDR